MYILIAAELQVVTSVAVFALLSDLRYIASGESGSQHRYVLHSLSY